MRRKPIKAKMQGCMTCANIPDEILDLNTLICITDMDITITVFKGDFEMYIHPTEEEYTKYKDKEITIAKLLENCKSIIEFSDSFCISFLSAFREEVYEYCKETKKMYLVEIGNGYA